MPKGSGNSLGECECSSPASCCMSSDVDVPYSDGDDVWGPLFVNLSSLWTRSRALSLSKLPAWPAATSLKPPEPDERLPPRKLSPPVQVAWKSLKRLCPAAEDARSARPSRQRPREHNDIADL
eukprot:CAMPEP_0195011428 /NCGR_PEP_ID=MMETSP0326_2-20130528/10947_1 /TAXON_ID=2866 ORGANISM="Crypthecodinium cohnii, Strain Seligo" /NCGR_SAMPLE_ID=MMETSP0326_2 /ASSEMBLY_ACC=CAM_ASM_000348 /LENGTH=122 /DNA_ID=CAMNT_0040020553 /DNA_START=145 /DNA_END=513 /DNA_ORIENTATION=-